MNYGLLTPKELQVRLTELSNLINPNYSKLAGWVDAMVQLQSQTPAIRFIDLPSVDFPNQAVNVLTALNYTVTTVAGAPVGFQRVTKIDWSDAATLAVGEKDTKILQGDVVNNNAVANTLLDTGLEFTVKAGQSYHFEAFIPYTAQATTTGSRWVLDGPASVLTLQSVYTLTAIAQTTNYVAAYNLPAACNASSLSINNAQLRGSITANANGTVKIRFASEIANSAITAKAGAILTYTRIL